MAPPHPARRDFFRNGRFLSAVADVAAFPPRPDRRLVSQSAPALGRGSVRVAPRARGRGLVATAVDGPAFPRRSALSRACGPDPPPAVVLPIRGDARRHAVSGAGRTRGLPGRTIGGVRVERHTEAERNLLQRGRTLVRRTGDETP